MVHHKHIWILIILLCLSGIMQFVIYTVFSTVKTTQKQRTLQAIKENRWEFFDMVCSKVIENKSDSAYWISKYLEFQKEFGNNVDEFTNKFAMPVDCSNFISRYGFATEVTKQELEFPIAFGIVTFKDPEQSVRLLRAIWRPQNIYCIHMDTKSSSSFKRYIESHVKCLDNVIFAPRTVDVRWGEYSVLEADLICMEALFNHRTKWKYFINLTGQEFPLKTNYELVKILTFYAGGNDIYGQFHRMNKGRLPTGVPPPHGIRPAKGPVHIAASRGFVDYVFNNQTAKDFLTWTKLMKVPDETFFPSLNTNPHLKVPGSLKIHIDRRRSTDYFYRSMVRFKIFSYRENDPKCTTKKVHAVCIFGISDLHRLTRAPHLFVNKFHQSYEPLAYDCLERWIFKKLISENQGNRNFDLSPYRYLDFVNNCYCSD